MNPTLSDVHVNTLLTNLSLMYAQEESNFVADKIFPVIPVSKASDLIQTYSRADFNRNTARKRAVSTETAGGGYKVGTTSYSVDVWGLHKDIDDQIRANADAILNLDMEATRYLTMQMLISKEIDWVTSFFAGSVWTGLLTGVAGAPGPGGRRRPDSATFVWHRVLDGALRTGDGRRSCRVHLLEGA